jgi:hypothetical protein
MVVLLPGALVTTPTVDTGGTGVAIMNVVGCRVGTGVCRLGSTFVLLRVLDVVTLTLADVRVELFEVSEVGDELGEADKLLVASLKD